MPRPPGPPDDERSPNVPPIPEGDRRAFAESMLDEWATLVALGQLKPASEEPREEGEGRAPLPSW